MSVIGEAIEIMLRERASKAVDNDKSIPPMSFNYAYSIERENFIEALEELMDRHASSNAASRS